MGNGPGLVPNDKLSTVMGTLTWLCFAFFAPLRESTLCYNLVHVNVANSSVPPGDGRTVARRNRRVRDVNRSEEHTSELQSRRDLVCRLLLEKKKKRIDTVMHVK